MKRVSDQIKKLIMNFFFVEISFCFVVFSRCANMACVRSYRSSTIRKPTNILGWPGSFSRRSNRPKCVLISSIRPQWWENHCRSFWTPSVSSVVGLTHLLPLGLTDCFQIGEFCSIPRFVRITGGSFLVGIEYCVRVLSHVFKVIYWYHRNCQGCQGISLVKIWVKA